MKLWDNANFSHIGWRGMQLCSHSYKAANTDCLCGFEKKLRMFALPNCNIRLSKRLIWSKVKSAWHGCAELHFVCKLCFCDWTFFISRTMASSETPEISKDKFKSKAWLIVLMPICLRAILLANHFARQGSISSMGWSVCLYREGKTCIITDAQTYLGNTRRN